MISIDLARELRDSGLAWQPAEHDHFTLLDRQMDGQIFIISHMTALLQLYHGQPVITFHGSSEWALDHVMVVDAVWMPSEAQLREMLVARIAPDAPLRLLRTGTGYRCELASDGRPLEAEGPSAADAYGRALLGLLRA